MRSLLKNSGILMIGELFTKVLSVLYLIPLIRINENIGILNATVTIPFGLFVVFGTLGINILLTSEIAKRRDHPSKLRSCLLGALMLLVFLSVSSGLILLIFAKPIVSAMISDPTYLEPIIIATRILSIGVLLFSITAYLRTIITAYGYFQLVSASYIIEQILKVGLILLGSFYFVYYKQMDVGIYAIILSISIVVSMIFTLGLYLYKLAKEKLLYIFKEGEVSIRWPFLKTMLWGGVVILAASIYASFFEMIDISMTQHFLQFRVSPEENDLIRGIYFTSSWKIVFIPISIAGGIITVMMTKIGGNQNDKRHFDTVFNFSLLFGLISMVLLFGVGERAFYFLYNQHSLAIILFQSLLVPAYIIRNILGTYVVSADGKKSSIIISLIIMVIIKIIFNFIFMIFFNFYGVVFSSLLAIIVSIIYLAKVNQDIFIVDHSSNRLKLAMIIISIIACIIVGLLNLLLTDTFVNMLILFVIDIIICVILYLPLFKKMVQISRK